MYVRLLKVIARDLSRNWLFVEIETLADRKDLVLSLMKQTRQPMLVLKNL